MLTRLAAMDAAVGARKLQLISQCWFLGFAPKSWLSVSELKEAARHAKQWRAAYNPTWRANLEGRRLLKLVEQGDREALKQLRAWVEKNESLGNPLEADGAETIAICVGYGFHAHLLSEAEA